MKQVRFVPIEDCQLQVREAGEGQQSGRVVTGRPIIFGVRSVNLTPLSNTREVYEVLESGCISDELMKRSDVILNINHSTKVTDVLGRCRNGQGTLSLQKREGFIEASCELPNTTVGNDTLELIRRGDISGMSFAFDDKDMVGDEMVSYENTRQKSASGKEIWVRKVRGITGLFDVSIVTHPAYEQTSVAMREASEAIDRDIELQLQRECGGGSDDDEAKKKAEEEEKAKREQEDREAEELERKAREAKAVMRMRLNLLDLETEEIDF